MEYRIIYTNKGKTNKRKISEIYIFGRRLKNCFLLIKQSSDNKQYRKHVV